MEESEVRRSLFGKISSTNINRSQESSSGGSSTTKERRNKVVSRGGSMTITGEIRHALPPEY
jgi:hypothetical protein